MQVQPCGSPSQRPGHTRSGETSERVPRGTDSAPLAATQPMTRLLVGMLRRARRLLAEARGVVPAAAQETVSSAAQPVTQPVSSASQAAHALLRAVLAAQRQHAALALFAARCVSCRNSCGLR